MTFRIQLSNNCTVEILKAPNQPHKRNTCAFLNCNRAIYRTSTYCSCHAQRVNLSKRLVTLKRTLLHKQLTFRDKQLEKQL